MNTETTKQLLLDDLKYFRIEDVFPYFPDKDVFLRFHKSTGKPHTIHILNQKTQQYIALNENDKSTIIKRLIGCKITHISIYKELNDIAVIIR